MSFARRAVLAAAASAALPLACLDPTQATVVITTNVPCGGEVEEVGTLFETGVGATERSATPGSLEARTKACKPPKRAISEVGSVVLVPEGGALQAAVLVVGAIGVGVDASDCLDAVKSQNAGILPSCIIARRVVPFVDHKSLELPVLLDLACAGLDCGEGKTCVREDDRVACADARVQCDGSRCDTPSSAAGGGGAGGAGGAGGDAAGGGGAGGAGGGGGAGVTVEPLYVPSQPGDTHLTHLFGFADPNNGADPSIVAIGTLPSGNPVEYAIYRVDGPAWAPELDIWFGNDPPTRVHGAGNANSVVMAIGTMNAGYRYSPGSAFAVVNGAILDAYARGSSELYFVASNTIFEPSMGGQQHPVSGANFGALAYNASSGVLALGGQFCVVSAGEPVCTSAPVFDADRIVDAWGLEAMTGAYVLTTGHTVARVSASTDVLAAVGLPQDPALTPAPTRIAGRAVSQGIHEVWVAGGVIGGFGVYVGRVTSADDVLGTFDETVLSELTSFGDIWVADDGRGYLVADGGLYRLTPN